MESDLAVIERALFEFNDIQSSMLLAREENAVKTYASLKGRYLSLKAVLNVAGVNLADIDIIKE